MTTRDAAFLALCVLCAAGCKSGGGSASNSEKSGGAAPVKVAFLLSTLQEERYQKDQKYFEDARPESRPRALHAGRRQ